LTNAGFTEKGNDLNKPSTSLKVFSKGAQKKATTTQNDPQLKQEKAILNLQKRTTAPILQKNIYSISKWG
jgi:hypothetical protein